MRIPEVAKKIIEKLKLIPLEPEGGYFQRTYESKLQAVCSPSRPSMTAIYYLILNDNFSAFHKLKSDEVYHFYAGSNVGLSLIDPKGKLETYVLGSNPLIETPQVIVGAEVWQGCKLVESDPQGWALLGTTVSPGFDFSEFELGSRKEMIRFYPQHETLILSLTRD